MYPVLPCPDLDEAIAFYEALGFRRSYRQLRPNPYAVVALEDLVIHLVGIEGFDPDTSVGSVIVVVPDAESLYRAFAAGVRQHCGRLPSAGVPRILRPRRKQGTATGFTVVDVGGNWLRFYRAPDAAAIGDDQGNEGEEGEEEATVERSTGLARVLEVAARQGDARGNDAQALEVLERGLRRHPDDPALDRVRVLLYQVEVLLRLGQVPRARDTLAQASQVELTDHDQISAAADFAHAQELLADSW